VDPRRRFFSRHGTFSHQGVSLFLSVLMRLTAGSHNSLPVA